MVSVGGARLTGDLDIPIEDPCKRVAFVTGVPTFEVQGRAHNQSGADTIVRVTRFENRERHHAGLGQLLNPSFVIVAHHRVVAI
ncbi:hypothetical protein BURMUCGD1_3397 [Burkholderia multivorans CGD1]|nr:hypothetical protein BURMUCGD1_3397 [Burkholderia multivorans CGD1]